RTLLWFAGTHNPLLPSPGVVKVLDVASGLFTFLLFVSISLCVASLFHRYRRANAEDRAKLKWIAYAGAMFVVILMMSVAGWQAQSAHQSLLVKILQDLSGAGTALIPAAALVSVLRYRLYEIDRIISRTLSYAVITAVLGAVYVVVALA